MSAWASARSRSLFEGLRARSPAARSLALTSSIAGATRTIPPSKLLVTAPSMRGENAGSSLNCTGVSSGPVQFSECSWRPMRRKPAASSAGRGILPVILDGDVDVEGGPRFLAPELDGEASDEVTERAPLSSRIRKSSRNACSLLVTTASPFMA